MRLTINGILVNPVLGSVELAKELGERFVEVQRGCIVAERAIDRIADRIYLVNGEALTYTVRNKKEIVEKLEMIDYSPEIDTYLRACKFRGLCINHSLPSLCI